MTPKEFRAEKGWTLLEMARRVDRAPATVSRIERGINPPSADTAMAFRRVSGGQVTFEDLYTQPRTSSRKRVAKPAPKTAKSKRR